MTLRVRVKRHLGGPEGGFDLDADFTSEGRVTALFGRSGAGKSTLVNLIAGLLRPDSGRIEVDDFCLFDSDRRINRAAHRRRIGYVFQEGRLFPHLSVSANLLFGQRYTARRRRWASFDEVVELLGIGDLLDRRPAALSGGEKQRVAIGRALLSSPQLLLMDEPLASLDQERKGEILPFIERLRDRMKMPIVYVSHAVDEVARLADTVVLLEQGKVAASGSVNEVLGTRIAGYADGTEAGVILAAMVVGHDRDNGISRLSHAAGDFSVPLIDLPVGAPVRLRIRARDVALAVGDPGRISIRNRLAGMVSAIDDSRAPSVTVRLNIAGDPLVANVTREAVRDLGLKVGMPVIALVKSAAFDPLSVGREASGNEP